MQNNSLLLTLREFNQTSEADQLKTKRVLHPLRIFEPEIDFFSRATEK